MKKVLVVSAHDTVVDSVANKYILEDLKAKLPNAVFDDLDAQYAGVNASLDGTGFPTRLVSRYIRPRVGR